MTAAGQRGGGAAGRWVVMLGAVFAGSSVVQAQEVSPPAYRARQLHCARFLESAHSEIETETGRGAVKATTDRTGVWSFRARDSAGGVLLEAWHDSLELRRHGAEGEVRADTDGLIGGRYRGVLTPSGAYTELARPFIPDEVAEVADLSVAARDLLPPLPGRVLATGESWTGAGLELARLPDTAVAGRSLLRFRLQARSDTGQVLPRGDTVPIPLRQTVAETGEVYWSPSSGLVRRTRDIIVDATIPSGERVRQPVRSRVTQRVELTRLPSRPTCK